MSNLSTLPDRAKTVHNRRGTIFGYVTNGDDEERTARNEADGLKLTIAGLNSAGNKEQEPPRPLPPPEPHPPRRPWPGTNKKLEPTKHANGACHEP